ncbi:tyrosine-type recombinase/integrase [Bordetella bronchiseptica]|nr:tyrosine-type recombinase/integrase [Bordetella bronchiseptica]KAB1569263.1 tyrosine-type recombinase/integrase [Bordetella bronchiseptica]
MGRPRKSDKHLPPCVYEKHGAYYYVKGGKWARLAADLPTALAEYARRFDNPRGGMADLVEKVLTHVSPKLSPNTIQQYKIAAARIKDAFAEFAPDQVRPKHVAALKVDMADTPNMANRVLSFLKTVFAYAVEWQLVDSNPCIGIKRHNEGKRKRYITDAEYAAIYHHANPRMQVIMDLLYLTGQRVGDVLAIKRSDLTEDGIVFEQEKTGAKLLVRWIPELRDAVVRANALNGNVLAPTLFRTRSHGKGAPSYGTTRDRWREAVEAAGVQDANIHDIRAKSLTDAKRQGKDAQLLAGHASPAMTDRYIRLRETLIVDGPTFNRQAMKSA